MIVREARPDDAIAIARIHVDTWRSAYRGLMPDAILDDLSYERRAESWEQILQATQASSGGVFVAQADDGGIVGFASGGPSRSAALSYAGELYALYVLADRQGRGVGRALTGAVAAYLARLGARSIVVWALEGGPANGFYAALGGRRIARQPFEINGFTLYEIGYGWEDTSVLLEPGS